MSSDTLLHAKARAAIELGWIPGRRPDHLWGRPRLQRLLRGVPLLDENGGSGAGIQFVEDGGASTTTHDVHIRCYMALEDEWNRREAAGLMQHSPRPAASNVSQGGGS